ncbi:MAG: TerB family tellurite resistance protein [Polyangiaceae bacterium]
MVRHEAVARLLMGAAYADDHLDGAELAEVANLLRRVTGQSDLEPRLQECIDTFDPKMFDVVQVAASLQSESVTAKTKILELVVAVHEADDSWDFAEDDYVRQVGAALGLEPHDIAVFVVGDLHVESGGFVVLPPPLPVTK